MKTNRNQWIIPYWDYYQFIGIISTDKYQLYKSKFHKELKQIGFPVPKNKFNFIMRIYAMWQRSIKEYGVSVIDLTEKVLRDFCISPHDKRFEVYRDLISINLSLGVKPNLQFLIDKPIGFTRNPDLNNPDKTWIQVNSFTRLEDFDNFRDTFKKMLTTIPHNSRNTPWKYFERDFKIYMLALNIDKSIKDGSLKKTDYYSEAAIRNLKRKHYSIITPLMNHKEYGDITNSFNSSESMSEQRLKTILEKCAYLFDDLNLL
ncbi:MAG TPA: hypothetical protein VF941_04440 [Clostridia bacterium]